MKAVKAGDEVRIYDANGKRLHQPDGGWPGEVVKAGRTLAHITSSHPYFQGKPLAFRLDDGRRNDRYGHQRFLTMDEVEERERRRAALAIIEQRGLQEKTRHGVSLEVLEAVATALTAYETNHQEQGS